MRIRHRQIVEGKLWREQGWKRSRDRCCGRKDCYKASTENTR